MNPKTLVASRNMSRRLLQCSAVEDGSLGGRVTQCAFTWVGEGECYLICTRTQRERERGGGKWLRLGIENSDSAVTRVRVSIA